MNLDEKQSEVFWGVYHRYEKEKEQLEAKRLRLLGTYIEKYDSLSNDDVVDRSSSPERISRRILH